MGCHGALAATPSGPPSAPAPSLPPGLTSGSLPAALPPPPCREDPHPSLRCQAPRLLPPRRPADTHCHRCTITWSVSVFGRESTLVVACSPERLVQCPAHSEHSAHVGTLPCVAARHAHPCTHPVSLPRTALRARPHGHAGIQAHTCTHVHACTHSQRDAHMPLHTQGAHAAHTRAHSQLSILAHAVPTTLTPTGA